MNFFNLTKRTYRKWLNESLCSFLKTGRPGEKVDPPTRSESIRKFASILLTFDEKQCQICWEMAQLTTRAEIEEQQRLELIRELADSATEQEDPLEGSYYDQFLVDPPCPISDEDQDAVAAESQPNSGLLLLGEGRLPPEPARGLFGASSAASASTEDKENAGSEREAINSSEQVFVNSPVPLHYPEVPIICAPMPTTKSSEKMPRRILNDRLNLGPLLNPPNSAKN